LNPLASTGIVDLSNTNTVIFDSTEQIPSKVLTEALELLNSERPSAKARVREIMVMLLEKHNHTLPSEHIMEVAIDAYKVQLEQKMHRLFDPFL
jgi:hypothetical protein